MWTTREHMQVEQPVSDKYIKKEKKKQSCHSDCEQNKNSLKVRADTDFQRFCLNEFPKTFSSAKHLPKYHQNSTSGVSQLPETVCCTCQCVPLPVSVEVAQENVPHSSSLAMHSGPGSPGYWRSSGPCLSRTPYTWPHCPCCKVCKSIPSECKENCVGASNHSDNPLPLPASSTLPLKTLQTAIQEGRPPQYSSNLLYFPLPSELSLLHHLTGLLFCGHFQHSSSLLIPTVTIDQRPLPTPPNRLFLHPPA